MGVRSISDNSEPSKESPWKSELHVMYLGLLPTILNLVILLNHTQSFPEGYLVISLVGCRETTTLEIIFQETFVLVNGH